MVSDTATLKTLALLRFPVLNSGDRIMLEDVVEDAAALMAFGRTELESLCGRSFRRSEWQPAAWLDQARGDLQFLRRLSVRLVRFTEPDYPPLLRETARPPAVLFVRGSLPAAERPALAIVGTRFPTGRGLEAAAALARDAAKHNVVVVSGLARGVDAAAHGGALQGRGCTIAVLGCGIDQIYPKANRRLAASIIEHGGCLVSEYLPGLNPSRWTFPERNRIIAGLARATLVIEAPEKSGALITADFALEEGRDVYVAQDCLGSVRAQGCDALRDSGAKAVRGFADIAEDWSCGSVTVGEPGSQYTTTLKSRRRAHGY